MFLRVPLLGGFEGILEIPPPLSDKPIYYVYIRRHIHIYVCICIIQDRRERERERERTRLICIFIPRSGWGMVVSGISVEALNIVHQAWSEMDEIGRTNASFNGSLQRICMMVNVFCFWTFEATCSVLLKRLPYYLCVKARSPSNWPGHAYFVFNRDRHPFPISFWYARQTNSMVSLRQCVLARRYQQ